MKVNGCLGHLLPPGKKFLMWSECPSFGTVSCSEENSLALWIKPGPGPQVLSMEANSLHKLFSAPSFILCQG